MDLTTPIVQSYILYSAILAVKLLAVGTLTSLTRLARGCVANPEDTKFTKAFKLQVKFGDPAVERTRRAHRNDLENIPAFWILGALYLTTNPVGAWALLLFRVYTACRILHTIVYAIVPLPQPSRAIAYMVPYAIKLYTGAHVILYYISAL